MKTFLLQYQYDGRWFCFDIIADSWHQAETLANMSPFIKLDGEKTGEVPLEHGEGPGFIILGKE